MPCEARHAGAVGVALRRRDNQVGDVAADGFFAAPAEHAFGGGIPLGDDAVFSQLTKASGARSRILLIKDSLSQMALCAASRSAISS
jgi:hypothetical protein